MVIDKQMLESFDLGIQKIFNKKMIEILIRRLDDMNKKYRNLKDSNTWDYYISWSCANKKDPVP